MRMFAWMIAVGVLAVAPRAVAEGGNDHDKAVAAFEEARRQIDAGKCADATPLLAQSLSYEPSVGAHLSLADCYEAADVLHAWKEVKAAAMLAFTLHDERYAVAERRAAELQQRLPILRIAIPPAVLDDPALEVTVDGVLVDRFFYREGVIATTPGKHDVEVSVTRRRFHQQLVAEPNAPPVIAMLEEEPSRAPAVVAPPPAPAPPPHVMDDPGAARRRLGYTVGAAGLVGIGVGAVFGVVALSKRTDLAVACGGDVDHCTAAPRTIDRLQSSAQSAATASTIGFVSGGVLLAGGAVLVVTAPSARMRIAPSAASGGPGVLVDGRF